MEPERTKDDRASRSPVARRPVERSDDAPVLPEVTRDESEIGWGDRPRSGNTDDEWLREQRPPHWD